LDSISSVSGVDETFTKGTQDKKNLSYVAMMSLSTNRALDFNFLAKS
jgi:hypothetical protein